MKQRLFAGITAAVLLLLCACGRIKPADAIPPLPPTAFESDLIVIFDESRIEAHMRQASLGQAVITVTAPDSLVSLVLEIEGSRCTVQYKGISFATDLSKIPESAFGAALMSALAARLQDSSITAANKEGKWHFEGSSSLGGFLLVQDAATGYYEYLAVPTVDLTIQFNNFQEL